MSSLDELLAPWITLKTGIHFNQLALDSRRVRPGDTFVAIKGHLVDGRNYIDAAIANGAVAVLAEHATNQLLESREQVPVVGIRDLPRHLSTLALKVYPEAARPTLVGVTGTNGKTTVSQLIAQWQSLLGQTAGVMGTVGNGLWGDLKPSANTTSDAVTVARELANQALAGADAVALEVSSHGLSQHRTAALPFAVATYTNLSRDHLDYHGDMASYAEAKKTLFATEGLKAAVLNLDDGYGNQWHRELAAKLPSLGYSAEGARCAEGKYLTVSEVNFHDQGVSARVSSSFGQGQLDSALLGPFNLANLLAALGTLLMLGHPLEKLLAVAPQLESAAGRMERFSSDAEGAGGATLVVDYAHTPDALEQALKALRPHCEGQLWCVFGCGGDRDRGKRPLMARAAEQFGDHVVITADNPRSEAFEHIVDDMLTGLVAPENVLIEADRAEAVRLAYGRAQPGDMVLLAGKGHEDYQVIGTESLPYNERALAQRLVQGTDEKSAQKTGQDAGSGEAQS